MERSSAFTAIPGAGGVVMGVIGLIAAVVGARPGYLSCEKTFSRRTPRTEYTLTASGRRALEKYLNHMDAIIRAARSR